MGMIRRFFAVFLLLWLAVGCAPKAAPFGASGISSGDTAASGAGASDEGEEAAPAVPNPVPVSGTGSPDRVASARGGVIEPPLDGERLGTGLVNYAATYGPGFTTPVQGGTVFLERDHLNLNLLVQREVGDLETGAVERTPAAPGMQIRLVHRFRDATGVERYVSCDTLTTAVQPDGHNASFSNITLSKSGGPIYLFYVRTDLPISVPTADYHAVCGPLGTDPHGPSISPLPPQFLAVGTWYEVLGDMLAAPPAEFFYFVE